MFKTLVRYTLVLFSGLLLGQIPLGSTTLGRSAWQQTQNLLFWSGAQAQHWVKEAGLTDIKWDWIPGRESQKRQASPPRSSTVDKEAMRKLLE